MTVQANLPPTNNNSDGTTTTFEYNFKVTREEHLTAMYTVIATGETGDLEIDSVTGVGDDGGGTVTFAAAPADGMIVTINSIAPLSQIEAFTGNKLPPATVERAIDAQAIINQRQQSEINRTVRFPGSDEEIPTLPAKAQRADKILGFTADGSDFAMVEGAAASQAYVDQAEAQADRAVAAATYPYTSGEQKTGAFMPGAGESLTLFTYNSGSAAAVTLPALSGLAAGYNIGICRTAGSGDMTISADDGAQINGAASIVHASDYLCLDLTINEAGDAWVAVDKALVGLPIGTGANNLVQLNELGELPSVSGANLTNLDSADAVARDMAATALAWQLTQIDSLSVAGASLGNLKLSDNFQSDTLLTSTNALHNASGDFYTNYSGTSDAASSSSDWQFANSGTWWTMTGGDVEPETNGVKAFGDTQDLTGDFVWSGTLSAADCKGFEFGVSSSASTATGPLSSYSGTTWGVTLYDGFGASAEVRPFKDGVFETAINIEISQNDTIGLRRSGSTLTLEINGETAYTFPGSIDTGNKYRAVGASNLGGGSTTNVVVLESPIWEVDITGPDNMTLAPTASAISVADPSDIVGYFVFEPIDVATFGTDVVGKVSVDGGTTKEAGTWTKVGDLGSTGKELYRLDADVSAQSGSSLTYEITTFNTKSIRYHDCIGLIPLY